MSGNNINGLPSTPPHASELGGGTVPDQGNDSGVIVFFRGVRDVFSAMGQAISRGLSRLREAAISLPGRIRGAFNHVTASLSDNFRSTATTHVRTPRDLYDPESGYIIDFDGPIDHEGDNDNAEDISPSPLEVSSDASQFLEKIQERPAQNDDIEIGRSDRLPEAATPQSAHRSQLQHLASQWKSDKEFSFRGQVDFQRWAKDTYDLIRSGQKTELSPDEQAALKTYLLKNAFLTEDSAASISAQPDKPANATVDQEPQPPVTISASEQVFNDFAKRYETRQSSSEIAPDDAALEASCVAFAVAYQENHPRLPGARYPREIEIKRRAAAALIVADWGAKTREAEKLRWADEKRAKVQEQARREALAPGQADFEDYVMAYQQAKNQREYKFVQGSRYLREDCIAYARQRLEQSGHSKAQDAENEAIRFLLSKVEATHPEGVSELQVQQPLVSVSVNLSAPPAPPASPAPRWLEGLRSFFNAFPDQTQAMPEPISRILMPHQSPDQADRAWVGLRRLLSPGKVNLSLASIDQQASTEALYLLEDFELTGQLLRALNDRDIEDYKKNIHLTSLSTEQENALQSLKKVKDPLGKELEKRMAELMPRTRKTPVLGQMVSVPKLDELDDQAYERANRDFNEYVEKFSGAKKLQRDYKIIDNSKYLSLNCVAVATSVIDQFGDTKSLIKQDQDRVDAARYLIEKYNTKAQKQSGVSGQ